VSEGLLFEVEGTGQFASEEREKLAGRKVSLYRCPSSLPDFAMERYSGMVMDTIKSHEERQTSFQAPTGRVEKDAPAVRIVDKKQEGHAITLQKWRGVVKSVSNETFIANVTDLLFNDVPEEEVELFCSDVQEDDEELLFVGAVFYWHIGHVFSPSGQLTRASFLRFQRLPLFSQESVRMAAQKAKDIQERIKWK
jgi:hypothetical protein